MEDRVVDFGREVADKEVVVLREVLLLGVGVLIGPIDPHLEVKDAAAVKRLQGRLGGAHLVVLDKAVVDAAVLHRPVGDDLDSEDGTGDGKDLLEHVLGHARAQVADVEVGAFRRLSSGTDHGPAGTASMSGMAGGKSVECGGEGKSATAERRRWHFFGRGGIVSPVDENGSCRERLTVVHMQAGPRPGRRPCWRRADSGERTREGRNGR